MEIHWTDYMRYRAALRGFDLARIEQIVLYSIERYFDTATQRRVVAGSHGRDLVLIPFDQSEDQIIPVTVHVTSRQQINFRLQSGRYQNE